jgi:hypothetical protein
MEPTEIETKGYRKLVAEFCELNDVVARLVQQSALLNAACLFQRMDALEHAYNLLQAAQVRQQEEIQELQYLLSEEIMRQLVSAPSAPPNVSGATSTPPSAGDVTANPAFVHSPGYPQDDGEFSGAER